jgi:indolepyruvate ferredoxin oxidoreductase beta subunit
MAAPDATGRLRVLLVGAGGQGVLTAAGVLGQAATAAGVPVTVGQLHGMSQRGGSVESTVLYGPGRSAFIGAGEADVIVGFELLETLRAIHRAGPRARVLVSTGRIPPFVLAQRAAEYPDTEQILARLREGAPVVIPLDGPRLASEAGDARALNAVMLGALQGLGVLPVDEAAVQLAIERQYGEQHSATNLRAFGIGLAAVRGDPVQP